jgi:uncharacterized protein (TIGR02996 family)
MAAVSDRNAFLRAICEQPADDAPRLVFADWLDENGESERAEFIRVQCKLEEARQRAEVPHTCCTDDSDHGPCRTCEPFKRLHRRSRQLLEDFAHGWFRDAFPWLEQPLEPVYYAQWWGWVGRGFVAEVACPLGDWLDHGKAICEQHPVERVRITDRVPYFSVSDNDWSWIYTPPDWDDEPHVLPRELWNILDQHDTSLSARVRARRYRTREHALARLNVAVLTWARKQAELPPLKEKQA